MTTQIHKCHPRDTEEQLYDVPLHDVELNDVANVRHKSASSCVLSWLHGNLAHYLMLFPRKAYKHKMPAWVWICTLHGCPPHHVLTNLSLSMYHKQPRRIDWYGLDTKKKIIFANVSYKSTVLNLEKAGFGVNGFEPHKLVMGGSNSVHQGLQEGIVDCVPVLPTPLVGGCGSQRASSSKIGKLLA